LQDTLKAVGFLVAPTTLLTALLYYFGRLSTAAQFSYFRVPQSALALSLTDYVLLSLNPMVEPVIAITLLVLAGIAGHGLLTYLLRRPGDRVMVVIPLAAGLLGILAITQAGMASRQPTPAPLAAYRFLLPPVYLALGIVLILYGIYLRKHLMVASGRGGSAEWPWSWRVALALAGFLVLFLVFAAVARYADAYGRTVASGIVQNLDTQTNVRVFSAKRLALTGPDEHVIAGEDTAYRYRYCGLRLLGWYNGKYILLPDDWPNRRASIILPESDDVRIELSDRTGCS
jgi:hypothetical protein